MRVKTISLPEGSVHEIITKSKARKLSEAYKDEKFYVFKTIYRRAATYWVNNSPPSKSYEELIEVWINGSKDE